MMYAVEIEKDITEPFIEIPDYEMFKSKHVKIIFMTEDKDVKEKNSDWASFIDKTAGSLSDTQMSIPVEQKFETREDIL